jgi:hypothetical protein
MIAYRRGLARLTRHPATTGFSAVSPRNSFIVIAAAEGGDVERASGPAK